MMASKGLKLALGGSLVLNIFLLAGAGTFWMSHNKGVESAEAERRTPRLAVPAVELINTRSPQVAETVLADLRELAMSARDDFQEARKARRLAINMTASEEFDPTAVSALLEQSRASEIRGRGRLESGAVVVLSKLDAEDRMALAPLLSRKGHQKHTCAQGTDRVQSNEAIKSGSEKAAQ